MLAPFLLIAHAALEGLPCPSDDALAEVSGTRSPGRVRRLLAYIAGQAMIVTRIHFAGKRSIALPRLGRSYAADDLTEAGLQGPYCSCVRTQVWAKTGTAVN